MSSSISGWSPPAEPPDFFAMELDYLIAATAELEKAGTSLYDNAHAAKLRTANQRCEAREDHLRGESTRISLRTLSSQLTEKEAKQRTALAGTRRHSLSDIRNKIDPLIQQMETAIAADRKTALRLHGKPAKTPDDQQREATLWRKASLVSSNFHGSEAAEALHALAADTRERRAALAARIEQIRHDPVADHDALLATGIAEMRLLVGCDIANDYPAALIGRPRRQSVVEAMRRDITAANPHKLTAIADFENQMNEQPASPRTLAVDNLGEAPVDTPSQRDALKHQILVLRQNPLSSSQVLAATAEADLRRRTAADAVTRVRNPYVWLQRKLLSRLGRVQNAMQRDIPPANPAKAAAIAAFLLAHRPTPG